MIRRPLILAVTAALLAAVPASADELKPFTPPTIGPLNPVPNAAPIKDVVIGANDKAVKQARKDAAVANLYPDGDGHTVSIQVSDLYLPDPVRDQALATFFGTLDHGAEMSRLKVMVVKPLELVTLCSGDALACYQTSSQTMIVSGDGTVPGQAPNEFVMAHEYGHHLARNNTNPPFSNSQGAGVSGPKYWASYAGVCPGVDSGYFSLDPVNGYYRFPGEVFAETFAQKQYPGAVAWEFDTNPPTAGDFAAINQDVTTPWTQPVTQDLTGKFKKRGGSVSSKVFTTPLDGDVSVALRGPKKARLDLQLLSADGTVLIDREGGRARSKRVAGVVCGQPKLQARVIRKSGQGKFKLTVARP